MIQSLWRSGKSGFDHIDGVNMREMLGGVVGRVDLRSSSFVGALDGDLGG